MKTTTKVGAQLTSIVAGMLWLFCALPGSAQVGGLDVGFTPGAVLNGAAPGIVKALALQADGKLIIVGDFTSIGGVNRGRVARMNTDGSLDTGFATGAGADGPVEALALQTDGKVVIGGDFLNVDGTARGRVARLTAAGALDPTFTTGTGPNAGANATVRAVALLSNQIYIGGDFTQVNGSNRGRFARLASSSGSLDTFFATGAGASGPVYALASSTSPYIFLGGAFTTYNGQPRNRLAEIDALGGSGSLLSFNASGGPDGPVFALALSSSSSSVTLFVGGDFLNFGTSYRAHLAAFTDSLSSFPMLDATFNIWTDGTVRTLAILGTARLMFGGDFTIVEGQNRPRLARLRTSAPGMPNSTTFWELDPTFNPPGGLNGNVRALTTTGDGKSLIGGDFSNVGGMASPSVARLYGDAGSLPPRRPRI